MHSVPDPQFPGLLPEFHTAQRVPCIPCYCRHHNFPVQKILLWQDQAFVLRNYPESLAGVLLPFFAPRSAEQISDPEADDHAQQTEAQQSHDREKGSRPDQHQLLLP